MNRKDVLIGRCASVLRRLALPAVAGLLLLSAARPPHAAGAVIEIGPAAKSRVPRWDARGSGKLPWQGIACLDLSEDGRFLAQAPSPRRETQICSFSTSTAALSSSIAPGCDGSTR